MRNARKPRPPRPWKRFKGVCRRGKVVSLVVPVSTKATGKFRVRIKTNGQMTSAEHSPEELEMMRAFVAFNAQPPAWYEIANDYHRHTVHWLLHKHGMYEALLPEQRGLICLDMAQHVLPLFEREAEAPEEISVVRKALQIARPYARGSEQRLPAAQVRAEQDVFLLGMDEENRVIERTHLGAEALAAITIALDTVSSAPPLGVTRDDIVKVAQAARDVVLALDDLNGELPLNPHKLGPATAAEMRWQGARLVRALDPAKVCRGQR
jgi:hypothetical protein